MSWEDLQRLLANTDNTFIFEQMKYDIINQKWKMGEHLSSKKLENAYPGFSVTVLREALLKLQQEGFVVSEAHVGFSVISFDLKEYLEYILAHSMLTIESVTIAAGFISQQSISALEKLLTKIRIAQYQNNYSTFQLSNETFFEELHYSHPFSALRTDLFFFRDMGKIGQLISYKNIYQYPEYTFDLERLIAYLKEKNYDKTAETISLIKQKELLNFIDKKLTNIEENELNRDLSPQFAESLLARKDYAGFIAQYRSAVLTLTANTKEVSNV